MVEVDLSLESLERRVEERLNEKVNFLLERLDSAVQVEQFVFVGDFDRELAGYGAEPGEPGDRNEEF